VPTCREGPSAVSSHAGRERRTSRPGAGYGSPIPKPQVLGHDLVESDGFAGVACRTRTEDTGFAHTRRVSRGRVGDPERARHRRDACARLRHMRAVARYRAISSKSPATPRSGLRLESAAEVRTSRDPTSRPMRGWPAPGSSPRPKSATNAAARSLMPGTSPRCRGVPGWGRPRAPQSSSSAASLFGRVP